jgi:hypothetical protein
MIIFFLVHLTFTTDANKNPHFTISDLQQNNHRKFTPKPTFYNSMIGSENGSVQNMFKHDDSFNCSESERNQNRKRKRHNKQTCLAQEDNEKDTNKSKKEYDTKSQAQYAKDNQHNYTENKKDKLESVPYIFSNFNKKDENFINLNENKNTGSAKRKRFHNTSFLEENDKEEKRKKEYYKQYRTQSCV